MAKNKNRMRPKASDTGKAAPEQSTGAAEQMESTASSVGSKTERKRQAKKFGHN
ncbi:hypothetical protein [Streptomyces alkaliterrae]|uniref:Uncharacterized protein n=1 Tax=Streptomyces alkaliterrae TaxID=2213162 RepID=A0A7W3WL73_9ACTN|nr:hypothetical protein [Streptomyces alkaliterrae]MBB1253920.1 hypothetical protein [Streptomyces alkaliterrae]MBB1260052.1 hypothetical protein [Streptomyces alkaliterrae]